MSFYKALCNAIGSGAGVAYPIFGIVSGAVQSSIGDLVSLTLGYFCLGLFTAIALGILYYSYKEMATKKKQFLEKYATNQKLLFHSIQAYIQNCKELPVLEQISSEPLVELLLLIDATSKKNANFNLKYIMQGIQSKILKEQVMVSNCRIAAFFGFVGTFGSLAGSGAGLFGLLTGTGFFEGFGVFPLLAWSIVATALLFGILSAVIFYNSTQKECQLEAINQRVETIHNQLNEFVLRRDSHYVIAHGLGRLGFEPKEELLSEFNQPVIDFLKRKNLPLASEEKSTDQPKLTCP